MKKVYIVAENAFTITVDEELRAWKALKRNFRPFAVETADNPVIDIEVAVGEMPKCDAESIYEPVYGGVGSPH